MCVCYHHVIFIGIIVNIKVSTLVVTKEMREIQSDWVQPKYVPNLKGEISTEYMIFSKIFPILYLLAPPMLIKLAKQKLSMLIYDETLFIPSSFPYTLLVQAYAISLCCVFNVALPLAHECTQILISHIILQVVLCTVLHDSSSTHTRCMALLLGEYVYYTVV